MIKREECRMLVYFLEPLCLHNSSLGTGQGLSYWYKVFPKHSAIVMFQQGCLRDITRARHLIKAESASVFVLFTYPLFVLYSPQPFGSTRRGFDSQGTSHRPRVHYRLFNLSLSMIHVFEICNQIICHHHTRYNIVNRQCVQLISYRTRIDLNIGVKL